MAGGPLTGIKRINIDVTRGVLMATIMKDNTFHGHVTSCNNYTGPPPREEAGLVEPREPSDGEINICTYRSLAQKAILLNNRFEGNVDFQQNINIPLEQNGEMNEERINLR